MATLTTASPVKQLSNWHIMARLYESGLATTFNISSLGQTVLYAIAFHYNVKRNDSYPNQLLISERVNKSIKAVGRAIRELREKGLISVTKSRKGNLYRFTELFFESLKLSGQTGQNWEVRQDNFGVSHDIEHEKEQEKEQIIHVPTSVVKEPSTEMNESLNKNTELLSQLRKMRIFDAETLLKTHGESAIKRAMGMAETNNITNKGGYIRTVLKNGFKEPENKLYEKEKENKKKYQALMISAVLKYKKTGKVFMAKEKGKVLVNFNAVTGILKPIYEPIEAHIDDFEPATMEEYNKRKEYSSNDPLALTKEEVIKFILSLSPPVRAQSRMVKMLLNKHDLNLNDFDATTFKGESTINSKTPETLRKEDQIKKPCQRMQFHEKAIF